ncbi:MAG TPA: ABC transporter substrate-binding protein [bacterium]|nr:ABC transporter substrate-binding protein [bacterium]
MAQHGGKGEAVTRITRRGLLTGAAAAGAGLAAGLDRTAPGWLGETPGAGMAAAAPRRGGTLRIAEIGEPLTLDTVATTADLTSTITLPVFEELFIFDANWRIQPLLASSYSVSKDGLTYTFTLRKNVPFHNGRDVTPADVVASLNRWGRVSPRGPSVYQYVDSVQPSADGVVMKLKRPYAPLLAFLALPNGAAAIMPREIVEAAGTSPIKQFVGTGPYRFVEWAPDRYVKLARFDHYAARSEPASGYAGRREALADEILYYPVSQVATRIAGVQSGDYDVADGINQDAYASLKNDQRVVPEIIRPGSFLTFFFNKKQGIMANEKLREAVLVALDMQPIMSATFGNPDLYSLYPSVYPKGTPWYTTAGSEWYNVHNTARAKELMKEAGYSGQPVRWLTTQQYDYMFKSTVVATSQLQQAGFTVDMQVLEWAGVLDHRNKPADYDLFTTSHGFVPDPALITVFSSAYPGWWDTSTKNALLGEFTSESDPAARVKTWSKLQALMYKEAAIVRPGEFYGLLLRSRALETFRASYWIVPWNVAAVK